MHSQRMTTTQKPAYDRTTHLSNALGCYPIGMSVEAVEDNESNLRELVAKVACHRGLTGASGKQSRQAIARKIRKHGLSSDYANALRAEIE